MNGRTTIAGEGGGFTAPVTDGYNYTDGVRRVEESG